LSYQWNCRKTKFTSFKFFINEGGGGIGDDILDVTYGGTDMGFICFRFCIPKKA
jgi:hypothetical protein